jgi:hypothetical protein
VDMMDHHPRSPFRPVDNRWRLANFVVDSGNRPPRYWLDPWTYRALKYIRRRHQLTTKRGRHRGRWTAAIKAAVALHNGPPDGPRLVVEARLLAGQNFAMIATLCGLTPDTVEAFEKLFFAVSDCLVAKDYITFHAIGFQGYHVARDGPSVIKLLAFTAGPVVLDAILQLKGYIHRPGEPLSPSQKGSLNLMLDVLSLPITPENNIAILRLFLLDQWIESMRPGPTLGAVLRPLAAAPVVDDARLGRGSAVSVNGGQPGDWCAPSVRSALVLTPESIVASRQPTMSAVHDPRGCELATAV